VTIDDVGAKALALPAQVGLPSGIATVQSEHLMGDVDDALRLLDAVERVRLLHTVADGLDSQPVRPSR